MNTVPHYNAFISYRHHPQDIAVAEAIHKGLERFKVPSSLRKQGKKIDRIFRDKEELPITSSLTDTITQALANSDFQIVICSTHLKDSYWVQREIEAFLQTHTKDQILTVIVDGEPNEVIPEILTYREFTDPVTGETVREPLEPLSCDWRLPKGKAMKTELPRLAAVLLGCTYNDLMQRQKQYQMQRMMLGGSVALALSLGFAGYFLYSSIRIQENLDQSLRNQSQYLASASETSLEQGDRLTAIALALEALPTEDNKRPYVIEAEKALSDALGLYNPTSSYVATQAFTADQIVEHFTLSYDGTVLYTLDSHNTVIAWDAATTKRLGTLQLQSTQSELITDAHSNLVVRDGSSYRSLMSYAPDGTLRWQIPKIMDFALTQDRELIIAAPDDSTQSLMTIDPDTGDILSGPFPATTKEKYSFSFPLGNLSYYQDHPAPFVMLNRNKDPLAYIVATMDMTTGKVVTLIESREYFSSDCVSVLPDGKVVVMENINDNNPDELADWLPNQFKLHCFDHQGKKLWQRTLTTYTATTIKCMKMIPGTQNLLVSVGNGLYTLNSDTGKTVSEFIAPSIPKLVIPSDDGTLLLFHDGSMSLFYPETGSVHDSALRVSPDFLYAEKKRGTYISKELSQTVLCYTSLADKAYDVLYEPESMFFPSTSPHVYNDTHFAIIIKEVLYCFDLKENTLLWKADWEASVDELLGFSRDGAVLYGYTYDNVVAYDTATGENTLLDFPTEYHSMYDLLLHGNHIYYLRTNWDSEKRVQLVDWDLTDGTCAMYDGFPEEVHTQRTPGIFYADDRMCIIRSEDGAVYALRYSDNTGHLLASDTLEYPTLLAEPDTGRITLGTGQEIHVLDADYKLTQTIPLPDTAAVSLFRHEGKLWAICDNEDVYCFDENGKQLSVGNLATYDSFATDLGRRDTLSKSIDWTVTDSGEIVVNVMTAGNIISPEDGTFRYYLPNMLFYNKPSDRLYCTPEYADKIVAYDLLSTEEVIARGRETLGDFTLTPQQKANYGLQ